MGQETSNWRPDAFEEHQTQSKSSCVFDVLTLLQEGATRQVEQRQPEAAQNRPILTQEQLRNLPGLVTLLDSNSWRERDAATHALVQAGARALPHILRITDSNDPQISLEQRTRCEQILGRIRDRQFQGLLDGMSNSDSAVRNASARVLGTIATRDLLEAASRVPFDMTDAQRASLRRLVLNRSSEEELNSLYSMKHWGRSNVDEQTLRRTLGLAIITNDTEALPRLYEHLGRDLHRMGAEHYTEAARLLEESARHNGTEFFSLQTLAAIRLAQGDTQRFIATAQRYVPSIGRLEGNGIGHWIPETCDNFQRQTQQLLNNPNLTAEQRTQIQTIQRQSQELRADYIRRNPPGQDDKKK